jgi:hypothetical protein
MRRFTTIAASALLLSTAVTSAHAEEAAGPSHLQVFAIGAGAVVGVIAANVITGGTITPILTGAAFSMPADVGAAAGMVEAAATESAAVQAAVILVGGAVGAAVGNWLTNGN